MVADAHGIVLPSGEKETCQDLPEYINMQDRPGLAKLHEDLYGLDPSKHPGKVCYMLVCRTVMGHTLHTRAKRARRKGKNNLKRGRAIDRAEVKAMNAQLQELQKDLPEHEQVAEYDYTQMYPSAVGDSPTQDGTSVFHSGTARELETLSGTSIRYNSLVVETCVSGKLWRAGKAEMCRPETGKGQEECRVGGKPLPNTGRVHRFREFVLFHGEQIYPEYLIAYERRAAEPPVEFFSVDANGKRWDYTATDSALIADARARGLLSVKLVDGNSKESTKGFEVHFTAGTVDGYGSVGDPAQSPRKAKAKNKRASASSPTGMCQVNLDNRNERVVEEKGKPFRNAVSEERD